MDIKGFFNHLGQDPLSCGPQQTKKLRATKSWIQCQVALPIYNRSFVEPSKNLRRIFVATLAVGTTIFGANTGATTFYYDVENVFYDGYDPSDSNQFDNDIAIVELVGLVNLYDYPNIKPACLPSLQYYGPAVVSG